jgi:hypothetical protein
MLIRFIYVTTAANINARISRKTNKFIQLFLKVSHNTEKMCTAISVDY